ncbi:DUF2516 family protein [Saxibacter everestensis]|uniref:DUF2516 family protein n=1 Tax=Saxibacter everestensis TaxID=2909229 RepID=A0ABY8QVZ0_9MICO|nr:DUF2516 family protein [Brevibacteriaceae bacterium ZFBP1038]
MIGQAQSWLFLILAFVLFAVEVFALVEALRHSKDSYVSAGKRTKTFWASIVGAATLIGFLGLPFSGVSLQVLGILSIVGFVAAAVFLADVRPALRAVGGKGRSRDRNQGPYGGW